MVTWKAKFSKDSMQICEKHSYFQELSCQVSLGNEICIWMRFFTWINKYLKNSSQVLLNSAANKLIINKWEHFYKRGLCTQDDCRHTVMPVVSQSDDCNWLIVTKRQWTLTVQASSTVRPAGQNNLKAEFIFFLQTE